MGLNGSCGGRTQVVEKHRQLFRFVRWVYSSAIGINTTECNYL